MTYHFKIFALALLVSGCSAFENMMAEKQDSLLLPPNVVNEQLLCESETPTACDGFLEDKPIIIEETEL